MCRQIYLNLKTILKYLTLSFILKPLILIMIVAISPSVETAMYFFNSNHLKFTTNEMALLNVLGSLGSICGQQFYRFFLSKYSIKCLLITTTLAFSLNCSLRLFITTETVTHHEVALS